MGISPYDTMLASFGKKDDINSEENLLILVIEKRYFISKFSGSNTNPSLSRRSISIKMNQQSNIATATVGEGSSNQGDFHEGLNFAESINYRLYV